MSHCTCFDGTRIYVEARGSSNGPAIVLIHDLGLSRASWGKVPDLLAHEHRVILYDLRGHDRSERSPTGNYDLFAHARDLERVIDGFVPPGQKVVLVGNSFGGGVMLAYAKQEGSSRLAGSVFAGSGGSAITLPGLPKRRIPKPLRNATGTLWTGILRGLARASHRIRPLAPIARWFVRRIAVPQAPREIVDQVRQDFMRTPSAVLTRTARTSGSYDPVHWADRLEVPSVVMHADNDPEVSAKGARRLANALPAGELVIVSGGGHLLPLTRPDTVVEQVGRLAGREGPGEPRVA